MKIQNHWSIKELYRELRDSKSAKFYHISFLLTRAISVITLVTFTAPSRDEPLTKYYFEWAVFLFVHILASVYIIKVRPFSWMYDNMIEWVNQAGYVLLITPLVTLNRAEDWTNLKIYVFIYGLLFTPACGLVISSAQLWCIICNKWARRTRVDPKIKYIQNKKLNAQDHTIREYKNETKKEIVKFQRTEEEKFQKSSVISSSHVTNSPISIQNMNRGQDEAVNEYGNIQIKRQKEPIKDEHKF